MTSRVPRIAFFLSGDPHVDNEGKLSDLGATQGELTRKYRGQRIEGGFRKGNSLDRELSYGKMVTEVEGIPILSRMAGHLGNPGLLQ